MWASGSCSSLRDAQSSTYGHANWALFSFHGRIYSLLKPRLFKKTTSRFAPGSVSNASRICKNLEENLNPHKGGEV